MEARCRGDEKLFRKRRVTRILRSVFNNFHFRSELVHDFILCYGQHVFLLCCEAVAMLVEVKDVGGEEGGFPPDVGEGFF